jgi:hypothetical protein
VTLKQKTVKIICLLSVPFLNFSFCFVTDADEKPQTIPASNKWKQRWRFTGQVFETI